MFYLLRYLFPMAMTLLCGCLSFNIESNSDKIQSSERVETVSVRAETIRNVCPRVWRDKYGRGRFSMLCEGDFRVEQSRVAEGVRSGRDVLSVGFFPGIYLASVTAKANGPDYKYWPLMGFEMVVVNAFTAGLPTLLALAYEPFDNYHNGNCGILSTLACQGLIGCCKMSQWEPWSKEFEQKTRDTRSVNSYALSDFTVSVGGVNCRTAAGKSDVEIPIPSGVTRVVLCVKNVPLLEGELGQYVNSLLDVSFDIPIEDKFDKNTR